MGLINAIKNLIPNKFSLNKGDVTYFLNDPSTPNLTKIISTIPTIKTKSANFTVVGYNGGGYPQGSAQAQAANVYITITDIINLFNNVSDVKLNRWAGTNNLIVIPRAGEMWNAYYDRRTLSYFYGKDKSGKTIYTADSNDVVSHELGHAILDSIRRDFYNVASMEIWAFHEAFGDIVAIIAALSHKEIIDHLITQTNGNLRQSNFVTKVAEQFAQACSSNTCLRDISNNFTYVNPSSLKENEENQELLAAEPHSFSRILSGALYEILVMMYEDLAKTHNVVEALTIAKDTLFKYVIKASRNVPNVPNFFSAFAETLLWVDSTQSNAYYYHDRMLEIFNRRNIYHKTLKMQKISYTKKSNPQARKVTKLINHTGFTAQSAFNLYNASVEIPSGSSYLYDHKGDFYTSIETTDHEGVEAAKTTINYLHALSAATDSPTTPFEIESGKLVRTHFACGCSSRPSSDNSKPYKPHLHAGCGCACKNPQTVVTSKITVRRGCYIRYVVRSS